MTVYDRWHKSRPLSGEATCPEHRKVPTVDHGIGDRWQVRWRDEQGEQRKRNFTKRAAADAFDAKTKRDLVSGDYVDQASGKIRFEEFAEKWRASQIHREATSALIERALRLHINPVIGKLPMASLKPSHIQGLVRALSETLSPSTVSVTYSYVVSICLAAVRDRVLARTPCVGIRLPAQDRKRVEPLDVETLVVIAETLPRKYRAIPLTATGTGLRPSEIFGLEPEKIDFRHKTLRVDQQLVTGTGPGHPVYLAPPKTPQSVRTIPLTDGVVELLRAHLEEFPATRVEVEDRTNPRKPCRRTAELVFTTTQNTPLKRHTWTDIWRAVAQTVGLPAGTGLHICRHTYASALIRYGESVKTVQHLLGHSSANTTLNTYSHLWPDADVRARSAVDAMFKDVPSLCPDHDAG